MTGRPESRFGETRLDLYEALWEQLPQIKATVFRFKDFLSGARDNPLADEFMIALLRELSGMMEGLY